MEFNSKRYRGKYGRNSVIRKINDQQLCVESLKLKVKHLENVKDEVKGYDETNKTPDHQIKI